MEIVEIRRALTPAQHEVHEFLNGTEFTEFRAALDLDEIPYAGPDKGASLRRKAEMFAGYDEVEGDAFSFGPSLASVEYSEAWGDLVPLADEAGFRVLRGINFYEFRDGCGITVITIDPRRLALRGYYEEFTNTRHSMLAVQLGGQIPEDKANQVTTYNATTGVAALKAIIDAVRNPQFVG